MAAPAPDGTSISAGGVRPPLHNKQPSASSLEDPQYALLYEQRQSIIDIHAERLHKMRTECLMRSELIQNEVRNIEGKLVDLFANQLKSMKNPKHPDRIPPSLVQWLEVVGLSRASINVFVSSTGSVEELLGLSDASLKIISPSSSPEEIRKLRDANSKLRLYYRELMDGTENVASHKNCYWDSWGLGSPRKRVLSRTTRTGAVVARSLSRDAREGGADSSSTPPCSPSPSSSMKTPVYSITPPESGSSCIYHKKKPLPTERLDRKKFNSRTPLAKRKNKGTLSSSEPSFGLTKAVGDLVGESGSIASGVCAVAQPAGRRLSNLLMESAAAVSSPVKRSDPSLSVPRSPGTPSVPIAGMHHAITHRFKTYLHVRGLCDFCGRAVSWLGIQCSECKYKTHRDCMPKVPPTCGCPPEYLAVFADAISSPDPISCIPTPPSPHGFSASRANPNRPVSPMSKTPSTETTISAHSSLIGSQDSGRTTVSLSKREDSQESQASEGDWPRQSSVSLKEWDIAFDELEIRDQLGRGTFGTVYRGVWHGDVCIKVIQVDSGNDEEGSNTLEAFKAEVAVLRNTRHENVVLFMGACVEPPQLAIVTALCKGRTLHHLIHYGMSSVRFNLNNVIIIGQQITQGMGYLHSRGIIHKDLKTKNLFWENGKVIITDFGIFSVARFTKDHDRIHIPQGWLCYLAPEIIKKLTVGFGVSKSLYEVSELIPFSEGSDVFAFGSVWYELLCLEYPFRGLHPETIIWCVGKGLKQPIANLQITKEAKDMLMSCWAYTPAQRPSFTHLMNTLTSWPRKAPVRSPSYHSSIGLSRSSESLHLRDVKGAARYGGGCVQ